MRRVDASDVLVIGGLVMFAGGLGAFDWRLALIACGFLLLFLGLMGALKRAE
jgi:hypothetical protein